MSSRESLHLSGIAIINGTEGAPAAGRDKASRFFGHRMHCFVFRLFNPNAGVLLQVLMRPGLFSVRPFMQGTLKLKPATSKLHNVGMQQIGWHSCPNRKSGRKLCNSGCLMSISIHLLCTADTSTADTQAS